MRFGARPRNLALMRACLAFAATLFGGIATAEAAATITVVNPTSLVRLDKGGKPIGKRDQRLTPEGVNFQDCVDEQQIQFTLQVAGYEPQASLEVWASAGSVDCSEQVNRSSTNKTCWKLGGNLPLQTSVTVKLPVREIMSGAPPFSAVALDASATACGKVDLAKVGVQFLYFAPGNSAGKATSKTEVGIAVDTVGPAPPSGLRTLPGNGAVNVTWDNISGEGGVTALTGINVYCTPAQTGTPRTVQNDASCTEVPREASVAEAGAVDDAGDAGDAAVDPDAGTELVCEDGGTTTLPGDQCTASAFMATGSEEMRVPDAEFNAKYLCGGSASNVGTSVRAGNLEGQPLANGTVYAVAVAATDAFGNVGRLSSLLCEQPSETTDFWEGYTSAGGGGGGCSTSNGPGAPTGSLIGLGLAGVVAASTLRRARRRAGGTSKHRS